MNPQTLTSRGTWQVTVVRAHGLRLMRPEKKWRPIIRLEVDKHHSYETVLGCDGQNVNMTEAFSFEDADANSLLDIEIFCQSQTKKKGKRKKLVASAIGHPLGRLVKTQELERKIELRLQCQTQNKNTNASRGKPQNGSSIVLRICPSSSFAASSRIQLEEEEEVPPAYTSDTESSHTLNDMPCTPEDSRPSSPVSPVPPQTLRRRVKGYQIYSDEEPCSSGGEEEEHIKKPLSFAQVAEELEDYDSLPIPIPKRSTLTDTVESIHQWIAASLLPVYTEKITVPPSYMNSAERALSSFTLYCELKEAQLESEYEPVFERLQREWQYVGGLLAALAAVNAAVFAISPDSLFRIQPYALSAIAASSMASGLGTAIDAWFLFRYNWIDVKTFIYRARDLYGSYFFFALCSRMPAVCMFTSALALMTFLGLVAFEVWPQGVLVVCFFVGLIMTLQFLVFGAHWCANKIVAGGKASKQGVVAVVRKMTTASTTSTVV